MRIIVNEEKIRINEPLAIALGSFDGIHKGHKKLLHALKSISSNKGIKTMVFTFFRHPMTIINPATPTTLLMDNKQKIRVLNELDIDYVKFKFFDEDFSMMGTMDFIKYLMHRYNIKYIVVGYNFTFGYKGRGDANLLRQFGKEFGFKVKVIDPYMEDGLIISSTLIRNLIKDGFIKRANDYLGYIYTVKGKVIHGSGIGSKLGYPTANISLSNNYTLPQRGVYITRVGLGKRGDFLSVTNIGNKPTFDGKNTTIETHILDFNNNIYSSNITIGFIKKLRDEKKFRNKDKLIEQISNDIRFTKQYYVAQCNFE